MKIVSSIPGVLHLEFPNRKELTLSMCRIEEFYESPYDNIRGKVFTWEEFLETYTKDDGTLDYFAYWDGFNVPGNELMEFFTHSDHTEALSNREARIFNAWAVSDADYLIATQEGCALDIVEHELAHARYYLNPNYRDTMDRMISSLGEYTLQALKAGLMDDTRYADNDSLLHDEIQAYLATSEIEELVEKFPSLSYLEISGLMSLFRDVLNDFKREEQCAS